MPTSVGRNDPCPCGSSKKYKKCCEAKDQAKEHALLDKRWKEAQTALEKSKEAEAEEAKNNPAAVPVARKPERFSGGPSKHQTFHAPKTSLPRRTGGG